MSMPESVSEARVQRVIDEADVNVMTSGQKTTVLHATLPNGFEIVTSSSCVDVDDFDPEIGETICRERLKAKVWNLLGFQQHPDL